MATVYSPNSRHDGTTASVKFRDGKAECDDPRLLDWFRRRGYRVEESGGQSAGSSERPPEHGPGSNKDAWVNWAIAQGADRDEAEQLTKSDLVELYG